MRQITLVIAAAIALVGCQKETLVPTMPFTTAHKSAVMEAVRSSGLNYPSEAGLNDQGYVYAVVNMPTNPSNSIGEYAKRAVLAMRNSVYVMPGADKNWPYKLRIMGPSPGPDLALVVGTARFDSTGATWKPGGF